MDIFSVRSPNGSFTPMFRASSSSTWWWLFKDGWRKTEASRYGIWLRPPASCESDSICFNVWREENRQEPSFLSEIWGSGYLFLVEQIHRCPHRSTVQLWYVLWAVALPLRGGTGSENILHFLVIEWKNFSSLADKTTFSHWVCPRFRDLHIHCFYVSLKPLQGHEREFFMLRCDLMGFWCAQLCLTEAHFKNAHFMITATRYQRFIFALKGWTHNQKYLLGNYFWLVSEKWCWSRYPVF